MRSSVNVSISGYPDVSHISEFCPRFLYLYGKYNVVLATVGGYTKKPGPWGLRLIH